MLLKIGNARGVAEVLACPRCCGLLRLIAPVQAVLGHRARPAQMDERHAPANPTKNTPRSRLGRATALKYTQDILRAYEQHLRR